MALDRGAAAWLLDELAQLYAHIVGRDVPAPPGPALQYIDYADFLARHAASPAGIAQRDHWAAELRDAPALRLPIDFERGELDARREAAPGGLVYSPAHAAAIDIPASDRAALVELARETRASLAMVLMAGLAATLHRLTGQDDLCLQSTLSHRHTDGLERMPGVVGNPLVMRLDASGRPSFRELVHRTRHVVLSAYQNSLARLTDRTPHSIRRVNFNFNFDPAEEGAGRRSRDELVLCPNLRARPIPVNLPDMRIPFDLLLWLLDRRDGIRLRLVGNRELFRPETCHALLRGYAELLAAAARDPSALLPERSTEP
jgi:hypothetical protein